MSKSSPSKLLKFRNLLWKLHYKLEKTGQHTSFEKLTDDPRYRAIILDSALKNTDNTSLTEIAEKIIEQEKILDIHYILDEEDTIYSTTQTSTVQKKDNIGLKAIILSLIFLFIAISIYSCQPPQNLATTNNSIAEHPILPVEPNMLLLSEKKPIRSNKVKALDIQDNDIIEDNSHEVVSLKADLTATNPTSVPAKEAVYASPVRTIMRLHGSNTIGEKLAPALIKAYLTHIGASDISTNMSAELEKSISAYLPEQGLIRIELHAHGSTTAFKDLEQGLTDMGMASRKIKAKEVALLKDRYGDLTRPVSEHILGLDGIAIIVNKANPITKLNTKQLAQLFSGEIKNWSDLGGDAIPVSIYSREANSGTWDTFKNLVLKKYAKKLTSTASRFESSSELSDKVSEDIGGIGFIGLPYVRHSKLLAIADDDNTQSVIPTLFTVGTEDYPLSRRLYFYTPAKQSAFMRGFIEFSQSPAGQNIVKQTGFISQNVYSIKPAIPKNSPDSYQKLVKNAERLSLNLRFQSGSDLLDNKALRDMERLTDYLASHPGIQLYLLGFSDSLGEADYNLVLSEKRARAIETTLQERGIYATVVKGFGESMPIASNMTKAGRNKNRRVEIWIEK